MNGVALRPWHLSFIVHAGLALAMVLVTRVRLPDNTPIEVPIEFTEPPKEVQNLTEVKERPKVILKSVNEPRPSAGEAREVFGANRNSHTDADDKEGIDVKKGNTVAKAADAEVLKDSDADALPTPTEEYLVSEMPSVLAEVRPSYPKEARDAGLEGAVAMDVLIDASGNVRQVTVIEGPAVFRSGALEAMKKFRFRPAKVDGQPVAVRIRYTLKFQLDY